jgi:hypothetical protein
MSVTLPVELQLQDNYKTVNSVKKSITITAPPLGNNYTMVLPVDMGLQGEVLQSSGNGSMSWESMNIPTYTTVNRLAWVPTVSGALVYDSDLGTVMMWNGGGWITVGAGSGENTFADNLFRITDNTTPTKQLAFECSNITPATTRTITVPDRDFSLNYASLMDQSVATTSMPTFANLSTVETQTIVAPLIFGYSAKLDLAPGYNSVLANAVSVHNYISVKQPLLTGLATLTDAAVFAFDANAGTHKAVGAPSTKTTPTNVDGGWIKVNINGTLGYVPVYLSKTA